ncbi:ABC transporter permease [Xanthobacter oligotrophicus]|uniref:ABC transporter permease n=1 Tax=Xanthobacter oligotrophicus TaxID=2607286 RepID=UPI0011F2AB2B|nr:ABC transporter permease [Xanthobacter oligotrophicus]MCG5234707.1 ABC transporter permease [Xanthobacter oligotrophicus]
MSALVLSAREPRRLGALGTASLLLAPIALVNAIGFLWPVMNLLRMSFRESTATGALTDVFSLATWSATLQDSFTLDLIASSVGVSLFITLLTLLASYPIALYLHRSSGLWRTVLMVLVVAPLLTSAVVRTYGWIAILSDRGLVAHALMALGMAEPPRLMFNLTGVIIGLTEILMPYMILALLSGFGRLDPRLEEAALTLGATPLKTFWRVVVPLTAPGMALGSLLCFVLAISSFVTPKLLGGGRVFLLATEIYDQAIVTLNWPLAAALSMIVLVVFGVALVLYSRALRRIA